MFQLIFQHVSLLFCINFCFFFSFYRSVVDTSLSFDSSGSISTSTSSAIFSSLPPSPLFTLNMDVPHSWMVEAVYSPYDLDNIHLAAVEREVSAEFILEYILVEGKWMNG